MASLTLETVEALLGAPDLLVSARPGDLAVAERLRARWPADLVAAATAQAELRARAAVKFTRGAQMLFTRAGLEQASGEIAARWRARRLREHATRIADLCTGIGGDALALQATVAVDLDPVHARLARHNAAVYDVDLTTVNADVRDVDLSSYDAIFIDPARRGDTARGGYRPPFAWCLDHASCIKAAPGLDRSTVPPGWEVEFVAVGRELRESVLWAPPLAGTRARATVLPAGATLAVEGSEPPAPVRAPGGWLLDPSPAVTRAGAVASVAAQVEGWQVDPQIAFLCADTPAPTAFGRWLHIVESLPFALRPIRAALRAHGIGRLDIRRRGLAGDVDHLRRRLRVDADGRGVLVMTRVSDRPWAFICRAVDDAPSGSAGQ